MKRDIKDEKISIIGAGNVGAILAQRILEHDLADVLLVDIDESISKGKAYDLQDAAPIMGYEKDVEGTSDFSEIRDSHVIVVTAGYPRKPGMSREDLIQKNSSIVKDVSLKIREYAPESIVIIVTNPLDIMGYVAYKTLGFNRKRVMGMAGLLDSARCSNLSAEELKVKRTEVDSIVIGSHDDNMILLLGHSRAQGKTLNTIFDKDRQQNLKRLTKTRGAEIVSLLKSGSAFFAPSAACFTMVKAILNNERIPVSVSAYLEGEYGLDDIFIGVPVTLGRNGIEEITELELTTEEREDLRRAAEALRNAIRKIAM